MEVLFQYILKSSVLLVLFYGCYRIFLRKETLFVSNRFFLLLGLLSSFILPFITINKTITMSFSQANNDPQFNADFIYQSTSNISPFYTVLMAIYLIGTLFLLFNLIKQGFHLNKIINRGQRFKDGNFVHLKSDTQIHPFSFFNTIVYNPINYPEKDLLAILAHEEVHAKQLHSLDIILMELVVVFHWFNPIVWLYRIALKQNLEFLADTHNSHIKINKKEYQYTLLKSTIGPNQLSIVNPFFNSIIKKRIVMINQNQSHKSKALKSLVILPLLALFLLSFNVKKVYSFTNLEALKNPSATIEFIINKNTTDKELIKMKSDLSKENFDFSYTTVRNNVGEIKNITLEISGGNPTTGEVSSRYNSASDNDTIDPTVIFIDTKSNTISIGKSDVLKAEQPNNSTVWVQRGNGNNQEKIIVKNVDGKKEVLINGKKVSEEEWAEMNIHASDGTTLIIEDKKENTATIKSGNNKQVYITTSPSKEHDIEIIEEEGNGFLFIDNDEHEPLYYLNGKRSSSEAIKEIDPNKIKSVNVLKGDTAVNKFGKKAKYGVVEITTKN